MVYDGRGQDYLTYEVPSGVGSVRDPSLTAEAGLRLAPGFQMKATPLGYV